ncbi:MAG: MFS transporter [Desulfobacterales bacterium]
MTETRTDPDAGEETASTAIPQKKPKAHVTWEKPSIWTKLAYAIPAFSSAAMVAPMAVELKIFYTDVLLVPAGLLALATAIARAFDALTDPLMASITDNTKTRWGRRKLYIPLGVPLSALCYWMMFVPPRSLVEPMSVVIWVGLAFAGYYLFHTIWAVPYHALGLEMTPDYDDRTSLFGIRAILGGIGVILSFAILTWLHTHMDWFYDLRQMLSILTGILAFQMLFFYVFPLIGVKENPDFVQRKGAPLVPGIRRALRNGPFKIILTVMIVGSIASSIPPLLMPYFSKYVLVLPSKYRSIFALIYVIAMTAGMPVWMRLTRKYGKLVVWVISAVLAGIAGFAFWFLRQGMVVAMALLEVVRGFCAGSHGILGPAMLADVVDYDELRTGKRREAQFSVFLSLLPKFISIIAATLPLAILGISGYDPSMDVLPDTAVLAIRSLFSWFPLGFQVVILIVILKYPISKFVHEQIREGVGLHRQGKEAVDPITGRTLPPHDKQIVDEDTGWLLDNFSVKELMHIAEKGTSQLATQVRVPIVRAGLICLGTIVATIWMLRDSMSMSQMDQLKQGIGSFLVIVAGLALTMTVFHILRLRAARNLIDEPVDADVIRKHLDII